MTAAAIKATYSDYRRVKGRKVLQLIFEVPIEQAPEVHQAFGEPAPDGSMWVAIARLAEGTAERPKGGRLAQKAGIMCSEAAFAEFVRGKKFNGTTAEYVHRFCQVSSRALLDHDEEAARRFHDLELSYNAWIKVEAA